MSAPTRRGFIGALLGGAAAAVVAPKLLLPDREPITNKKTFVYGDGLRRAGRSPYNLVGDTLNCAMERMFSFEPAPYSIRVFINETDPAPGTWSYKYTSGGTPVDLTRWRLKFEHVGYYSSPADAAWGIIYKTTPMIMTPPSETHWLDYASYHNYYHAADTDIAAHLPSRRDAPVPRGGEGAGEARPRGGEDAGGDHQAEDWRVGDGDGVQHGTGFSFG